MILGNCKSELIKTLESIEGFVDEFCFLVTKDDTGSTVKTLHIFQEATKCDVKIEVNLEDYLYDDGIPKSFARMRNDNFDMASHDIICWFDSDDIVICDPVKLRDHVLADFVEHELDGIHAEYDYEVSPTGKVMTRQVRERFLRRGSTEWKSPLHEVCSFKKRPNVSFYRRDVLYVQHLRQSFNPEIQTAQTLRNRLVIERFIDSNPDYEIRLDFYYAHVLLEAKEYERAIEHYDRYLKDSGFPEECYLAMLRKAACYRGLGRHVDAIRCCFDAIDLNPDWSEAYSDLSESYMERKEWSKVITWCLVSMQKAVETPRRGTVWNPIATDTRPRYMMREACIALGNWQAALDCNNALQQLYQNESELIETGEKIQKEIDFLKEIELHSEELDKLSSGEKSDYVKKLSPELQRFGKFGKHIAYNNHGKPTIAIFCSEAPEHWGPSSVEKGIGGSEEAVINMSKRLVDLGWHVEVFCNASEVGIIDGVVWRDWATLSDREYDVFVVWRNPQFLDQKINAKKVYLWLHDLQQEGWYTEQALENVDKIFCLSDFHRDTVPYLPDDKIWITSNGIDPDHFKKAEKREKKTLIYASSPDRGLERVLDAWPDIIKAEPDAKLEVYYGFNKAFDARAEREPEWKKWKEMMLQKLNQNGVTYHGMVSHKEIATAFKKATVWAYPTPFGEISCITAMKAQASGAIPVVSRYSAINETVRHGLRAGPNEKSEWTSKDLKEWTDLVISILGDSDKQEEIRKEMIPDAIKTFGWDTVASQWSEMFKEDLDDYRAKQDGKCATSTI
jgi:glycosyltransferase involved in cell wall biosynthesis